MRQRQHIPSRPEGDLRGWDVGFGGCCALAPLLLLMTAAPAYAGNANEAVGLPSKRSIVRAGKSRPLTPATLASYVRDRSLWHRITDYDLRGLPNLLSNCRHKTRLQIVRAAAALGRRALRNRRDEGHAVRDDLETVLRKAEQRLVSEAKVTGMSESLGLELSREIEKLRFVVDEASVADGHLPDGHPFRALHVLAPHSEALTFRGAGYLKDPAVGAALKREAAAALKKVRNMPEPLRDQVREALQLHYFDSELFVALEPKPQNQLIDALGTAGFDQGDFPDLALRKSADRVERYSRMVEVQSTFNGSQMRAIERLARSTAPKLDVFGPARFLEGLSAPQRWITNAPPELAQSSVRAVQATEVARLAFEMHLRRELGLGVDDLGDEHYRVYADEILTAATRAAAAGGPALAAKISRWAQQIPRLNPDGMPITYAQRTLQQMGTLGKQTGDCTRPGEVNFARHISWFFNPAQQLVLAGKPRSPLLKLVLGLGQVRGEHSVLIDAAEIAPDAEEQRPRYAEGQRALGRMMAFVKDLARGQQRELYAYRWSNTAVVSRWLDSSGRTVGRDGETVPLRIVVPEDDIRAALAGRGGEPYPHELNLFYQLADASGISELRLAPLHKQTQANDPHLDKLAQAIRQLPQEIPALGRATLQTLSQAKNADAKRRRALIEQAARAIVEDEEGQRMLQRIYGSHGHRYGHQFVAERLDALPTLAGASDHLSQTLQAPADQLVKIALDD